MATNCTQCNISQDLSLDSDLTRSRPGVSTQDRAVAVVHIGHDFTDNRDKHCFALVVRNVALHSLFVITSS